MQRNCNSVFVFLILFLFPLTASSAGIGSWFSPAKSEVKRLCKKRGGITIQQKPEIEGYFDERDRCASCWKDLILLPVEWIEFCQKNSGKYEMVRSAGCWRLSKARRTEKRCHKKIDAELRKSTLPEVMAYRGGYCIEVNRIDQPMAQYRLGVDQATLHRREGNFRIVEKQVRLMDINTLENLGWSTDFDYIPSGKPQNSESCSDYLPEIDVTNRRQLMERILNQPNEDLQRNVRHRKPQPDPTT